MQVGDALAGRISTRAYLDTPIAQETVRALISSASRAPSGGNLQPWQVHVVAGDARQRVIQAVRDQMAKTPFGETDPEYSIYPKPLGEPWRTRRFECGEAVYASLNIPREDKSARLGQIAKNFEFFGAPVGLFLSIHKSMQPGQWADLGMFTQSFMLAAAEAGLASCAQESWAVFPHTVKQSVGIGDDYTLFCGIALGHADPDAPVNTTRTTRAGVDDIARFEGF
jgi:nitroreductase